MIIEYDKKTGLYSMDSRHFSIKGTAFEIIGTEINRHDVCMVTVKNSTKGLTNDIEHQRLCRMILREQKRTHVEVVTGNKNPKHRRTGIGL